MEDRVSHHLDPHNIGGHRIVGVWGTSSICRRHEFSLTAASKKRARPSQRPVVVEVLDSIARERPRNLRRPADHLLDSHKIPQPSSITWVHRTSSGGYSAVIWGRASKINAELTGTRPGAKDWSGILANDLIVFSKKEMHVSNHSR